MSITMSRVKLILSAALLSITALLIHPTPLQAQTSAKGPYRPVTFSQEGWRYYGQNIVFSRWQYAFKNFSFYGRTRQNWLYVGYRRTMSVEGSKAGLTSLLQFLPQTSAPRSLNVDQNFIIPIALTDAGTLAGETVALTMNVAFNDTRMMPRHPGYDLEKFKLRAGPLRGKTVGQVLDIADRVLGGDPPLIYGLADYYVLTDVVRSINRNYEFIDYSTFIDRGYLIPNRAFGPAAPPHNPHVP